jgi:hypothetical protein
MDILKGITKVVTLFSVFLQVLDKCQLLEVVQEKEHGLDSLGRKFYWHLYNSFWSSLFCFNKLKKNRKLCLGHF